MRQPRHMLHAGRGGPALVLLHLFAGSALFWDPVVKRLADRHRCLAPDLRGFGASSRLEARRPSGVMHS